MGYIGFVGVLIGAFFVFQVIKKTFKTPLNRYFPTFLIIIFIVASIASSVKAIPVGKVAIVYQFGAIVDQKIEGLQVVYPWRDVKLANIMVQKETNDLECFSQETQDVSVKVTLNFSVSPKYIMELYRNIGPSYYDVVIKPKILQITKDETVKYKTVDVAPNRENIRKAVQTRLQAELKANSINVVDVLIENIDFSPAFKAAIEGKQIATQKALEELEIVKSVQYKAQQVVEKAKGDAEANRLLSNSLSPQIIQYTMIQKLSDKIQVIMLPSGNGLIIDPKSLLNNIAVPK